MAVISEPERCRSRLKHHAVCIGLNVYGSSSETGLDNLRAAELDARQVADWLQAAGSVARPHVLVSSSFAANEGFRNGAQPARRKARPSRRDIENIIINGILENEDTNCGGRLYLYFAGHGRSKHGELQGAGFCSARAQTRAGRCPQVLNVARIADFFITKGFFEEVVFLFDACRVPFDYPGEVPEAFLDYTPEEPHDPQKAKLLIALACPFNSLTFEKWIGGRWRGVFTHYFLQSLRKARRDAAGCITARDVCDYLKNVLPAYYRDPGMVPVVAIVPSGNVVLATDVAPDDFPEAYECYCWVGPLKCRDELDDATPVDQGGLLLRPGLWQFQLSDCSAGGIGSTQQCPLPPAPGYQAFKDCCGPLTVSPSRKYVVRLMYRKDDQSDWAVVRERPFAIAPDAAKSYDRDSRSWTSIDGGVEVEGDPGVLTGMPAYWAGFPLSGYEVDLWEPGRIVHVPV